MTQRLRPLIDELYNRVRAGVIRYVPSVPGNWNPVPSDVRAALDQLSAPNFVEALPIAQNNMQVVSVTAPSIKKKRTGIFIINAVLTVGANATVIAVGNILKDGIGSIGPTSETTMTAGQDADIALSWIDVITDTNLHTYTFECSATTPPSLALSVLSQNGSIGVYEL